MSIAILNSYRNDINMYQIMVAKLVSGILAMENLSLQVYYDVLQAVSTDPDVRRAILKGFSKEDVETLLAVETSEDVYKVKCAYNNGQYSEIHTLKQCNRFLDAQSEKCNNSIVQAAARSNTVFLHSSKRQLEGVLRHLEELRVLCHLLKSFTANKKQATHLLIIIVSAFLPLSDFLFHTVESALDNNPEWKPVWEKTLKEYLDELRGTMFSTWDNLEKIEGLAGLPLFEYGFRKVEKEYRTAYGLYSSILIFYNYMFEASKVHINSLKPAVRRSQRR